MDEIRTPGAPLPDDYHDDDAALIAAYALGIADGDYVYVDANNDGVWTSGSESAIGSGVGVELLDASNNIITSTTTNSSGVYGFTPAIAALDAMDKASSSAIRPSTSRSR